MKLKMKSSPTSRGLSIVLMVCYGLYALFNKGLPSLLLSLSLGLIFYGIKENLELAAAVVIVSGIVLSFVMKKTGMEGFEDKAESEVEVKHEEKVAEGSGSTAPGAEDNKKKEKAGFADINPAPVGEFKLGDIPKDEKGGFFIDQGTTLMNALNGLKPDQITAMSNDTKQLIETQKSLMGMLNTLAPMMKEGSNLLGMFNGMFGKTA
jgi:hypothetical protein